MEAKSKAEAQQRVDRIRSFQEELSQIEKENVLVLDTGQRNALSTYHDQLLSQLAFVYDTDSNRKEKQLSLGMKIVSFLGAMGLAASIFFLFYQFWGRFNSIIQVGVLITAPLALLYATMVISSREKTGYFSKILGMISLACFVLNLSMLGQIFNIAPSENAFLVWAGFAFVLAYASDTRLLLAMAIISFSFFLSARVGTWGGCYWLGFSERPENFFPVAFILFSISFIPHRGFSGFSVIYRVFAMLIFFIPVLILSNWGRISYMGITGESIEVFYQIIGFVFSGAAIALGIRKNLPEVVNTGNVFFMIFLYTKFFDWWWEWMPKYLFFLVIGLTAILMLFIFKRLRYNTQIRSEEVNQW